MLRFLEISFTPGFGRKNEPYIYKVLRSETPNPRQQAFFRAEAANIAYGGARGGGKSWAMRRKLVLLAMRYPGLKLLLFLSRTCSEMFWMSWRLLT